MVEVNTIDSSKHPVIRGLFALKDEDSNAERIPEEADFINFWVNERVGNVCRFAGLGLPTASQKSPRERVINGHPQHHTHVKGEHKTRHNDANHKPNRQDRSLQSTGSLGR